MLWDHCGCKEGCKAVKSLRLELLKGPILLLLSLALGLLASVHSEMPLRKFLHPSLRQLGERVNGLGQNLSRRWTW